MRSFIGLMNAFDVCFVSRNIFFISFVMIFVKTNKFQLSILHIMNSHVTKLCFLSVQVLFLFLNSMLTFHKFIPLVLLVRFASCCHFFVF
jgi:hypothetical protein